MAEHGNIQTGVRIIKNKKPAKQLEQKRPHCTLSISENSLRKKTGAKDNSRKVS
jgi:hypothetical protein